MKKILLTLFVLGTLVALYAVWQIFGPTVKSPADKYFYITTGAGYKDVLNALKAEQIISNGFFFDRLASQAKYQQNVKAITFILAILCGINNRQETYLKLIPKLLELLKTAESFCTRCS